MTGLFYHDVLAALTDAEVSFVVGRAQDADDVEALRRVREVLRGGR